MTASKDRDVKSRTEIEEALIEMRARQTVVETVQVQLMVRLAGLFDQPQEFIRLVMMHAEENLIRAAQKAPDDQKPVADAANEVMRNLTLRMMTVMAPKTRQ